jgi:hypothetical protein
VALAALVVAAALSLASPAAAATPHGSGGSVGGGGADVVVAVGLAAAVPLELATSTTPPDPAPSADPTVDDAERLLGDTPIVTGDHGDRWDPPWLAWMATLAAGLVVLALLWWLFLEVRIQDRL